MGDMGEVFDAMRGARQARHVEWRTKNMAVLERAGIPYRSTNYGETLLFRERGKPKVDFYPSTGRWRVAGVQRTFRGGAEAFLRWYDQQHNCPGCDVEITPSNAGGYRTFCKRCVGAMPEIPSAPGGYELHGRFPNFRWVQVDEGGTRAVPQVAPDPKVPF